MTSLDEIVLTATVQLEPKVLKPKWLEQQWLRLMMIMMMIMMTTMMMMEERLHESGDGNVIEVSIELPSYFNGYLMNSQGNSSNFH